MRVALALCCPLAASAGFWGGTVVGSVGSTRVGTLRDPLVVLSALFCYYSPPERLHWCCPCWPAQRPVRMGWPHGPARLHARGVGAQALQVRRISCRIILIMTPGAEHAFKAS